MVMETINNIVLVWNLILIHNQSWYAYFHECKKAGYLTHSVAHINTHWPFLHGEYKQKHWEFDCSPWQTPKSFPRLIPERLNMLPSVPLCHTPWLSILVLSPNPSALTLLWYFSRECFLTPFPCVSCVLVPHVSKNPFLVNSGHHPFLVQPLAYFLVPLDLRTLGSAVDKGRIFLL